MSMKRLSKFLYAVAIIWVGLAVATLTRVPYYAGSINIRPLYAGLMLGNAVAAGILARWWTPDKLIVKWVGYLWIGANILLTIADQMGGVDYAILGMGVAVLWMMINEDKN